MDRYLLSLVGFTLAATLSPGPNNVIVASIGARRGIGAALPYMLGVAAGWAVMILLVGTGLAGLFTQVPALAGVMRWVALAWIVFLAWQIATSPLPGEAADGRLPGFVTALFLQWVNPTGWMLALGLISAWMRPDRSALAQIALFAAVFALVVFPSLGLWTILGTGAARLLHSPRRVRVFNVAMAVVLVASMLPVVLGEMGGH